MPSQQQIFICYRRTDAAAHAGRLYDALSNDFGRKHVFFDRGGGIGAGEEWKNVIDQRLASCAALVALIGERWQPERLASADDLVRREISRALALGVHVIPVLLNDVTLPTASDLPEEMRPLLDRQVLEMTERHWSSDYGKLKDAIRKEVRRRRKNWWRPAAVAVAALLVILLAVYLTTKKPHPIVGTTTTTSAPYTSVRIDTRIDPRWPRGIDLRRPGALVNLTDDISFGFMVVGPLFDKLWKEAHDRRLIRGASHPYNPAVDPELQAEEFVKTVRPGPDDLLGVNINEGDGGSPAGRSRNLHRFLDRVERLTHKRCLIYVMMRPDEWDALFDSSFGDYPLMIAGPPAMLPRGWKRVAMWVGPRGTNAFFVFNGTKDEMLVLARPRT